MKNNDGFTLKMFFRKGSLLLNKKTRFPRKIILPKYFVILENYRPGTKSILGVMTTSKLWRLKANNNEGVIISIRSLRGPTLLLWNNIKEIPTKELLSNNYKHVGFRANMKKIDDKIRASKVVPLDIIERILKPESRPKPSKKKKKDRYRNFTKEQVDEIKKRLGLKKIRIKNRER